MRIRRVDIRGFRGVRELSLAPGPRTVILGPNNAGKSTILEALDLLLHSGRGRSRPQPSEIDYFGRDPSRGFQVEAVLGDLPDVLMPEVRRYLEGWKAASEQLVPEVEGDGIEPVIRVRVRGTPEFDVIHEFAKDEAEGVRFHLGLRAQVAWVFDGRTREPGYQLAFYQGGLLDRLFADIDLDPAAEALRTALGQGAGAVNTESGVRGKLDMLATDLHALGLLRPGESPQFEVGAVSVRELLQSLRLTLPGGTVQIPLARQGRGAQRLLLMAVLLRLAQAAKRPVIGGFEEPEEALEPIRQSQIAHILSQIADSGGQIFVVTHSPEVARSFAIDDVLLLDERAGGAGARPLRKALSEPVRQKYERWLDGAVVRALFARIPMLVEGPGDRAMVETFWRALSDPAKQGAGESPVRPREQIGLDFVNCEGAHELPMMARLMKEAGKCVVAWVELDVPEELARLRTEGHCSALVLHDSRDGHHNLEQALAESASIAALTAALAKLAGIRGYSWDEQCHCLVSSCEGMPPAARESIKVSDGLQNALELLDEADARKLIARLLAAKGVTPFEMKGARQARIVAETVLEVDGKVPAPFARAFRALDRWISAGCQGQVEIPMAE